MCIFEVRLVCHKSLTAGGEVPLMVFIKVTYYYNRIIRQFTLSSKCIADVREGVRCPVSGVGCQTHVSPDVVIISTVISIIDDYNNTSTIERWPCVCMPVRVCVSVCIHLMIVYRINMFYIPHKYKVSSPYFISHSLCSLHLHGVIITLVSSSLSVSCF